MTELLEELCEREIDTNMPTLFVIDAGVMGRCGSGGAPLSCSSLSKELEKSAGFARWRSLPHSIENSIVATLAKNEEPLRIEGPLLNFNYESDNLTRLAKESKEDNDHQVITPSADRAFILMESAKVSEQTSALKTK